MKSIKRADVARARFVRPALLRGRSPLTAGQQGGRRAIRVGYRRPTLRSIPRRRPRISPRPPPTRPFVLRSVSVRLYALFFMRRSTAGARSSFLPLAQFSARFRPPSRIRFQCGGRRWTSSSVFARSTCAQRWGGREAAFMPAVMDGVRLLLAGLCRVDATVD